MVYKYRVRIGFDLQDSCLLTSILNQIWASCLYWFGLIGSLHLYPILTHSGPRSFLIPVSSTYSHLILTSPYSHLIFFSLMPTTAWLAVQLQQKALLLNQTGCDLVQQINCSMDRDPSAHLFHEAIFQVSWDQLPNHGNDMNLVPS